MREKAKKSANESSLWNLESFETTIIRRLRRWRFCDRRGFRHYKVRPPALAKTGQRHRHRSLRSVWVLRFSGARLCRPERRSGASAWRDGHSHRSPGGAVVGGAPSRPVIGVSGVSCCRCGRFCRSRRQCTAGGVESDRPGAARERDVLLAVELVSHRWSHASAQTPVWMSRSFSADFIGTVSDEMSVGYNLEDKITRCGDRPAADAPAARRNPTLRLRGGVPGYQCPRAGPSKPRFRPDRGRSRAEFYLSGTTRPLGPKKGGIPMIWPPGLNTNFGSCAKLTLPVMEAGT